MMQFSDWAVIIAAVAAFVAASYWKRSAMVEIPEMLSGFGGVEPEGRPFWSAMSEAARLNALAARWSAVAAVLGGASGMLSLLGQ